MWQRYVNADSAARSESAFAWLIPTLCAISARARASLPAPNTIFHLVGGCVRDGSRGERRAITTLVIETQREPAMGPRSALSVVTDPG
jgi:hypothetical protein